MDVLTSEILLTFLLPLVHQYNYPALTVSLSNRSIHTEQQNTLSTVKGRDKIKNI